MVQVGQVTPNTSAIRDVTITKGTNIRGGGGAGSGAGIMSEGTNLFLDRVTVSGNEAIGAMPPASGGGIGFLTAGRNAYDRQQHDRRQPVHVRRHRSARRRHRCFRGRLGHDPQLDDRRQRRGRQQHSGAGRRACRGLRRKRLARPCHRRRQYRRGRRREPGGRQYLARQHRDDHRDTLDRRRRHHRRGLEHSATRAEPLSRPRG